MGGALWVELHIRESLFSSFAFCPLCSTATEKQREGEGKNERESREREREDTLLRKQYICCHGKVHMYYELASKLWRLTVAPSNPSLLII